jgi:hypothetical protein
MELLNSSFSIWSVSYQKEVGDLFFPAGHEPQMGLDTKTYWLTGRQSQCDFDFD